MRCGWPSPFSLAIALRLTLVVMGGASGVSSARAEPPESIKWTSPSPGTAVANLARIVRERPEELLRNPGFEEVAGNAAAHWGRCVWGNGGKMHKGTKRAVTRSTDAAHDGGAAAKLDASGADLLGDVLSVSQSLPMEKIRGRSIRYSLWSMLQTAPRPDGNPVTLSLRQWRGRKVIAVEEAKVYNDTGEWRRSPQHSLPPLHEAMALPGEMTHTSLASVMAPSRQDGAGCPVGVPALCGPRTTRRSSLQV